MWQWRFQRMIQRLGCGLVAGLVVWGLCLTVTATNVQELASTLWQDMALSVVRWQLGDWDSQEGLSTATVMALSQSAFLEVARPAVLDLWSQEQGSADPAQPVEKTPIVETPTLQQPSQTLADNGVEALTLTPSGSDGYLVCGNVYISATADVSVSADDILQPFAATSQGGDQPEILIIHTHTTEAYTPVAPSDITYYDTMRTMDTAYNVVAVGTAMTTALEAQGIGVLHDTTIYDYPSYNDSYNNALSAIEKHLEDHPSISFVIDVHRDAIEDENGNQYKVVTAPETGDTMAQLTLVVGTDGGGLPHETWLENLRLATALQEALTTQYPTLMRPLLLRNSRYNQHMTTGSLLLEVGAAGNSPAEAIAAGVTFAQEMGKLLQAKG